LEVCILLRDYFGCKQGDPVTREHELAQLLTSQPIGGPGDLGRLSGGELSATR
jgi:hypothetical protein